MIISDKKITLRDGREVTLRSPTEIDAISLIEHMKITAGETHFLMRYPEEICLTEEQEKEFIKNTNADSDNFILVAVYDGRVVGMSGARRNAPLQKYRHRGTFAISLQMDFAGVGLGSEMLSFVIENAKNTSFEQLELGTYSDNLRARKLYEKFGFTQSGTIPRAYKLSDGTYRDEIQMYLELK